MANNRARYAQALAKGLEFNQNQKWKEAIGAFRVAISEFPNLPEPYAGLGEACMGQKQLDRALECYKLAARHSKGDIRYLSKVADIQERMGRLSEAGRTYMAAGEVLLRQRDTEGAISQWERAVRLEPNLLGAHQRLAMAFQRQGDVKAAVREYLAIARSLSMQGENKKAMQMCRAALRLDPDNPDILTAIKLVRHGEEAYPDPEEEEEVAAPEPAVRDEEDSLIDAVRQMASVLESEKESWKIEGNNKTDDPITAARSQAQEHLAEEIFREEEDDELLYGSDDGLSKLERDALIGQAMDFESRGASARAIECFEKAIKGGLSLPAAYFTLALLYMDEQMPEKARPLLEKAKASAAYKTASEVALRQLG